MFLLQGRGEMAVTAVLLHQCSMVRGSDCSVVFYREEKKCRLLLQLLQYIYISALWIQGNFEVFLVQ